MSQKLLKEEKTSYTTLLLRKNRFMKTVETLFFLLGLGIIFILFEFRSPAMIMASFGLAIFTFVFVPFIHWMVLRPHYQLFNDHLVVQIGRKKESFLLSQMVKDFGLSYAYMVGDKRVLLLVSNDFLESLDVQLEVIRRGLS